LAGGGNKALTGKNSVGVLFFGAAARGGGPFLHPPPFLSPKKKTKKTFYPPKTVDLCWGGGPPVPRGRIGLPSWGGAGWVVFPEGAGRRSEKGEGGPQPRGAPTQPPPNSGPQNNPGRGPKVVLRLPKSFCAAANPPPREKGRTAGGNFFFLTDGSFFPPRLPSRGRKTRGRSVARSERKIEIPYYGPFFFFSVFFFGVGRSPLSPGPK